jgi:hypothetical protein
MKERGAGTGLCPSLRGYACRPVRRRLSYRRLFLLCFLCLCFERSSSELLELELDELLELELDELFELEFEELFELELDELLLLEFEELFELELDELLLLEFEELFELELPANWMNPSAVFDVVFADVCRSLAS